jgi:hypothetical protein
MIDYSLETATWLRRVQEIQGALRDKRFATALAKIADLQGSLVRVDAWVQERQQNV